MSVDFWASYISGAAGIVIGNPLDLIKVRVQAGIPGSPDAGVGVVQSHFDSVGALIRGAPTPILTYGALNALLFVSYHRTLTILGDDAFRPASSLKVWVAGAVGGLASWVVSAPTELIKCQAQISSGNHSSWSVARDAIKSGGLRGLYFGGMVTSLRDSIGYGFYFWSYELSKRWVTSDNDTTNQTAVNVLLCGGLAGVVTWASVFPLDVIKTRVQAQTFPSCEQPVCILEEARLLNNTRREEVSPRARPLGALQIARQLYRQEGVGVFWRGLGVCSARAFVVNAVQWAVYEWIMKTMKAN